MTRAQRRHRYRVLHRQQTRDEAYWQPIIEAALNRQMAPVLRSLRDFGIGVTIENLNSLMLPGPIADVLERLYIQVGVQNANSEYGWIMEVYGEELETQKAFGFNKIFADLMRNFFALWGGVKIVSITNTERKRVGRVLQEANEQRLSPIEAAKLLRSEVINRNRAKVIARTEIGAAAAHGTELGSKRVGILMDNVWISNQGPRTRRLPRDKFSHLAMNEVRVASGEMFAVPMKGGGVEMLPYPMHPSGSAANVIQCRCRHITEARRDANNRLIRVPVI